MQQYVDKLARNLNLSPYQSSKLKSNYDRYNISRLEKRGAILFAPYQSSGIWGFFMRMFRGVRADLIGENKMLLQAQRNIKFCANGYHCVRVGRYTYYADATGNVVSHSQFVENAIG